MQVVEWVLGPVRTAWTSPQWQQRLSSMDAFMACFLPLQQAPDGTLQVDPWPCVGSTRAVIAVVHAERGLTFFIHCCMAGIEDARL